MLLIQISNHSQLNPEFKIALTLSMGLESLGLDEVLLSIISKCKYHQQDAVMSLMGSIDSLTAEILKWLDFESPRLCHLFIPPIPNPSPPYWRQASLLLGLGHLGLW